MCHQRREIPRNDSSSSCNLSGRGSKTRMNQRLQLLLGGPISYSMWKRLTEHKHILMDVVPRPLGISVTEKNSSSHVKAFPYLTYWPGSWGRVSTCEGSHWSGPDHWNWVGLLAASLVDESWERPFRSNWGEREHGKACTSTGHDLDWAGSEVDLATKVLPLPFAHSRREQELERSPELS